MTRPDNTDRWNRRQDLAERHPFLSLLYWAAGIIVVVLVLVAIVGLATTGSVFFQSAASNSTLKARENIQRNSTNNAVASISYFHDQCASVQKSLAIYRVNQAKADRLLKQATADATDPIRGQQETDQSNNAASDAQGALNNAISAAADYNSKAANTLTSKFREAGLPDRINIPSDTTSFTIDCG